MVMAYSYSKFTNVHFVLNHLLIRYEMEWLCIEEYYTPNLETSKSIKIGDPTVNDYHVSSIWMMKESYHIRWSLIIVVLYKQGVWWYDEFNEICDESTNFWSIEEKVCNHRINDMEWTIYWIWMEWIWIHQEMKTTTWNHEYNTQISRSETQSFNDYIWSQSRWRSIMRCDWFFIRICFIFIIPSIITCTMNDWMWSERTNTSKFTMITNIK